MSADQPYFQEWDSRQPGARRSLARARALLSRLDLAAPARPVLTVVGSKGKGTTAVYASAYLAAAGRRVVTVTGPSLVSSTERIRVDGRAIDEPTLAALGERLRAAAPPPGDGYLSPSGLFTLAGLLHASTVGADVVVLEAGKGGASDEVSLVPPDVVAITPIFEEHLAELGGSLAAVVADKCGVVQDSTRAVLTAAQSAEVDRLVPEAIAVGTAGAAGAAGRPAVTSPDVRVPDHLLPPGLGRANALLGCAAADRLLPAPPAPGNLRQVLGSVALPGRLSLHPLPGTATRVLLDAAVSQAGFAAALSYARDRLGGADHVLVSLPDGKDLAGAAAELSEVPVTFVTVTASHLRYTRPVPTGWQVVPAAQVDRDFLAGLGQRVLGLGTISFIGHLVRLLDVPTSVAFRSPRPG